MELYNYKVKKVPQCKTPRYCTYCAVAFTSNYKVAKYCSKLCSGRDRAKLRSEKARLTWVKTCKKCGKGFLNRNKKVEYCTIKCSKEKRILVPCTRCGRLSHNNKFCSLKCRDFGRKIASECCVCNKEYTQHISVVDRSTNSGKFCSQKCYNKHCKGKNNPNWRGGGSYVRGEDWLDMREIIRKRDNYSCRNCNKPENGKEHDVHHIMPYRIKPDNTPINLITLCMNCHRAETNRERKLYPKK